ncbi:hypothetical protein DTO013E5_8418 [Penicillium roqueforti]|uniref:uncharacterized protein n=1 Tax=Penicillium roqueforti TaxID=5082 RepID=UPI00190DDEEC|nr:uncharacterized protein LCP9604111_8149 [Penicillium roqueforti]KAF9242241.1 hypothetical protein LCP9604111_8149 [Penicillium roqueforti]KAI1833408.1 hypothetical protein CBS147337_5906 [Penicillium roqueforti]KAI2671800.1 hypothetical protein CBS147355_8443 [Penicillium roqueforti]KAI2675158.1 hypothetical protein LCP963914a_8561 [Penicillium roqueforti]KAI2697616.1 hypothetical protein CBS147372_7657 [Penicillium roqueforti]
MDYRRLQHSYPPRPSPLGASQEPRDPHFTAPSTESRQEIDKSRPYPSPASNATSSPSQLYQSATSHTSNTPRGDTSSAYFPRNGPTQAHRRHGSLETRNHEQMHRRNNSQPQAARYREGRQSVWFCFYFPSARIPQIEDSKDRTCAVVGPSSAAPFLSMGDRGNSFRNLLIQMLKTTRHIKTHSPNPPPLPLPRHPAPDGFSPVAQIDWTTARER